MQVHNDRGYRVLDTSAVIRAGTASTARRAAFPLLYECGSAVFHRIAGAARRPDRSGSVITPDQGIVPTFGAASKAPGLAPGTLINAAPLRVLGTRGEMNSASSYRFEYVTGDSNGHTITATGGVCFSKQPWTYGQRPLVAFAPSTQGIAAHCDPSHTCAIGLNVFYSRPFDAIAAYELPVINWFLAHGSDVVFIDYPRDASAGIQYYCDSISAAKSLFDAVRAARQLGVSPNAPVGLWGFSQGGGAAGWAAQLDDYAPEIQPVAAVVGAPPSDLLEVLRTVDGGLLTGVIAYAVAGLAVSRAELYNEIMPTLNAEGLAEVLSNISTCAGGTLLTSGYRSSARWTVSAKALHDVLDDLPEVLSEFQRQKLGQKPPKIPVLLWGSDNDDVIPLGQVCQVRDAWVAGGADITWHQSRTPKIPGRTGINHFGPYFRNLPHYSGWLLDQLR